MSNYVNIDAIVRWLKDKPIRDATRFRLAALIQCHVNGGMTIEESWNYWLDKRPDFFAVDATPIENNNVS